MIRDGDMTDGEKAEIWNRHLDGWRASEIARYSWQFLRADDGERRECSPAVVRRVLSLPPPGQVLSDPRYIHGVRAFWIAATGRIEELDVTVEGMIAVFQPHRLQGKFFQKGVRAICRDFKALAPSGTINPVVMEGIEMEPMLRMLDRRRTVGWVIDEEGEVARYCGQFSPSVEPDDECLQHLPNP